MYSLLLERPLALFLCWTIVQFALILRVVVAAHSAQWASRVNPLDALRDE